MPETEKMHFYLFLFCESHGFASARGMVVLSREAWPCLPRKRKKHVFSSSFFLSREARFCFRERHGCAFVRGTGVPLSERKKGRVSVFFFHERHGFASERGTVVLSRESRSCLLGNEKKTYFLFFFRDKESNHPSYAWFVSCYLLSDCV